MNIVFVTTEIASVNCSSGGLASFTANMARIFAENGHQVFVVLASTAEQHIDLGQGISIISLYIPMEKWKKMDHFSRKICRYCKRDSDDIRITIMNLYKSRQVKKVIQDLERKVGIDIIHYCNHGSLNRLSPKKIPYIVRISGFLNICLGGANTPDGSLSYKDNSASLRHKLEEFTIKKAKYIVTPSNLLAEIVEKNMKKKAVVIESPYVLKNQEWNDLVLRKYSLSEKKYIIYYGTLKYLKGIHVIARLAKKFLSLYTDFYLVLAGKNNDLIDENGKKIKADEYVKVNAGEFAERVIYTGRLVREQLYPLVQNAELCLFPSRIENLSNACIEAMAMGKIVVATNGASYEQLIQDGENGFLCERDNPDSYFAAIKKVLSMNEEEKEKMSIKAAEVTKRLEPQEIYRQYLVFYKKVIDEWQDV